LIYLLLGFTFALALASFFLLPLVQEINYVNLAKNVAVNYQDHFPTLKELIYSRWGYAYSESGPVDGMSFSFGFAQWAVLFFSLIKLVKTQSRLPGLIFLTTLFTIFLMLPVSNFIWQLVPPLRQIQYPWRLLMSTSLLTSFLGAWLISGSRPIKYLLFLFLFTLAFVGNRHYLNPSEPWRYPDSYFQSNDALFNGSTDIAWEARPRWVDFIPEYKPANIIEIPKHLPVTPMAPVYPERFRYQVNQATSTAIVLNLFYYPSWQILASSNPNTLVPIPAKPSNHGLVTFTLPSGTSYFSLVYRKTPLEIISDYVSLVAWTILIILTCTTAASTAASTTSARRSTRAS
jgi:hypothetical protein